MEMFLKLQKRCEDREGDSKKKREHEQRLENKQTESWEEERKGDKKKMKGDKWKKGNEMKDKVK